MHPDSALHPANGGDASFICHPVGRGTADAEHVGRLFDGNQGHECLHAAHGGRGGEGLSGNFLEHRVCYLESGLGIVDVGRVEAAGVVDDALAGVQLFACLAQREDQFVL